MADAEIGFIRETFDDLGMVADEPLLSGFVEDRERTDAGETPRASGPLGISVVDED